MLVSGLPVRLRPKCSRAVHELQTCVPLLSSAWISAAFRARCSYSPAAISMKTAPPRVCRVACVHPALPFASVALHVARFWSGLIEFAVTVWKNDNVSELQDTVLLTLTFNLFRLTLGHCRRRAHFPIPNSTSSHVVSVF